jgi:hypothetical protein
MSDERARQVSPGQALAVADEGVGAVVRLVSARAARVARMTVSMSVDVTP